MIRRIVGLFLLLVCVRATAAAQPLVVGQSHRMQSTVLKEERAYRVSLPESYGWAKDRRYPVLYLLDGKSQFLHTFASVSYLAAQGDIPEMIVVAIDSTVRIRDFTQSDWPDGVDRGWRRGELQALPVERADPEDRGDVPHRRLSRDRTRTPRTRTTASPTVTRKPASGKRRPRRRRALLRWQRSSTFRTAPTLPRRRRR